MRPHRIALFLASAALLGTLAWPEGRLDVYDLASSNPEVALATAESCYDRQAAGQDVVADLVRGLSDPDPRVRARCALMLGRLDASGQADDVAALLADPDPYVRVQAALALRTLRDYRDPAPLVRALADRAEAPTTRYHVACSLAERRSPEAREAFAAVARTRTEPEDLRVAAVRGLGSVRAERELLLGLARDASEPMPVRRASLRALGGQAAHDFLAGLARNPRVDVRLRGDAAVALARSGWPGTRDLYDSLLGDPATPLSLRLQATHGVWLREEAAFGCEPLIREGLRSADPEIRQSAALLAKEALVVETCTDLAAARRVERDETTRTQMDEALARLEPEVLGDPDQLLREP